MRMGELTADQMRQIAASSARNAIDSVKAAEAVGQYNAQASSLAEQAAGEVAAIKAAAAAAIPPAPALRDYRWVLWIAAGAGAIYLIRRHRRRGRK
jgi:hypothetical protein